MTEVLKVILPPTACPSTNDRIARSTSSRSTVCNDAYAGMYEWRSRNSSRYARPAGPRHSASISLISTSWYPLSRIAFAMFAGSASTTKPSGAGGGARSGNTARIADREVGGCPVAKGQTIAALLAAANHDPALHEDADHFDIHRSAQKHFSFGGGEHFCPGATLARLELEVTLKALFTRFPDVDLDPTRPPSRKAHPLFDGHDHVWLRPTGA
ncbi:MAG: cytochrome P450 [Sphingomonas sp.]|nr:MAG: cytochrome P450 [Sphingomonas sp.]